MIISLILALAISNVNAEIALVIGGFGASDSVQVVTKDDVCLGTNANPYLPRAPDGRVGWTAQYVDGKVVVGTVTDGRAVGIVVDALAWPAETGSV